MAENDSSNPHFTFNHPTLGSLTGLITPENVVQFRAVPYATIPARFKRCVLSTALGGSQDRDFTGNGFACPQNHPGRLVDGGPRPGEVYPPPMDEFKCLILQVNVPLAVLQKTGLQNLPVMVYIHGGGFVLGMIDEQHNTAQMVEQSIHKNSPVIAVNIQYRLGALGYLTTPEETETNLALHDQRTALLWIQKFISGFGGDPGNVTAFGESAGAISICYHMLSSVPVFRRVVLMSGIIGPMVAPCSKENAVLSYERFLNHLGIAEKEKEGLEMLGKVPIADLVKASDTLCGQGEMWLPVHDEEWFGEKALVTWDRAIEKLGKCSWVEEVMLGTTGFEGTSMIQLAQAALTPATFVDGITKQLGHENATKLLEAYGITREMDHSLFLTPAMRWLGDILFDAPTHMLARHLAKSTSKKTYRYVFDVRSPFPGQPLYQLAHHWVDIYFVFKTFQYRYPYQRLKDISTKHASLWVDFANGKAPWAEYVVGAGEEEVVMVADEREGWVERSRQEDAKMADRDWDRCEKLWDAWADFRGKEFLPMKIDPLNKRKLV